MFPWGRRRWWKGRRVVLQVSVCVAGEVQVQAGEATQGIVATVVWLNALCDISYVALVWPECSQRIS